MRNSVVTTFLTALLLTGASAAAAAQVSIDIRIGPPPRPRVVRVLPRQPGPEYVWLDGYWYPVGNHYRWREGYWTRRPYLGARWIAPRYDRQVFFEGYWQGDRGWYERDRRWDRDRYRDGDDDRNRGNGRKQSKRR